MYYVSTRNKKERVSGIQAIVNGIAPDGGLYVPEELPVISKQEQKSLLQMDYAERAAFITAKFLPELKDELLEYCRKAYSRFDGDPAPLVKIDASLYLLELWHGPTHAFKDMALTLLPYLITGSKKKLGINDKTLILVATSGDTGKAALEGFKDVEGTACIVFYPEDGVSPTQKLQMTTQSGGNVYVSGIKGNFDDAQAAVKKIFTDENIKVQLSQYGYNLSSANSINWGRLLPQIAYYFSAYADLLGAGQIEEDEKVNFAVPTGNFGNILAGYYAMRMGLPVGRLICASNLNNVLFDFFESGSYNVNRGFYKTISPSMDILVSSNFERLMFETCGRDDKIVRERMEKLKTEREYEVGERELAEIRQIFFAGFATDDMTKSTIANFFEANGYILDPHSAVAVDSVEYFQETDETSLANVAVCTASPYKFVGSVLEALEEKVPKEPLKALRKLEDLTALPLPESILRLFEVEQRFTSSVEREDIPSVVLNYVKGMAENGRE